MRHWVKRLSRFILSHQSCRVFEKVTLCSSFFCCWFWCTGRWCMSAQSEKILHANPERNKTRLSALHSGPWEQLWHSSPTKRNTMSIYTCKWADYSISVRFAGWIAFPLTFAVSHFLTHTYTGMKYQTSYSTARIRLFSWVFFPLHFRILLASLVPPGASSRFHRNSVRELAIRFGSL